MTTVVAASEQATLEAGIYTIVYTAPSTCINATVNARIVSTDLTQTLKTRMAIVPGTFAQGPVPPDSKYWSQPVDLVIGPGGIEVGVLEDTGIVLMPNESVVMFSETGFATGRVHGFVRSA